MKLKSLLVIGALVFSTAAMASDGTANFRIDNGALVSFSYDADFQAGHITGSITRHGTSQVELSTNRAGDWNGRMGLVTVNASTHVTDNQNKRSVEVRTMDGIFDYTLVTNAKGDLEINTVSPSGEMLTAGLVKNGMEFSVLTPELNMGLSVDPMSNCACHFSGTAALFEGNNNYDNEQASLSAMGSLDLKDLANKDPVLFVLLYVLPFDLGN